MDKEQKKTRRTLFQQTETANKETNYVLKVLPNSTLSLPFKSEFYKTNFAKTEETELGQYDFYIMSACQYWPN